jgi:hypothetical protein
MSGATSQPGAGSSTDADFTYIVLGAAPGRQARELLKEYLSMDWLRGTPTATARTHDGRAITAEDLALQTASDTPPVLTFEAPPASVPRGQLVLLRATAPQVLARAARLPRLSGETVTGGSLGVLGAAWRGLPAGSIVYTRSSSHGTIAFVLHGYRVDPVTGAIDHVAPAARSQIGARNQAFTAMAATISPTGATIVESALTMAQFASFALGPKGVILAAGAAVLSTIFQDCMQPKPPVDLSAVVHDAVQAVAVSLQIEGADATIGADYDWLHDHYQTYWADDAPAGDADLQLFRTELEGKLASDTGIVQTVALLMEADYQERGFVLFLLGASLVLLLYKIAVIIESNDKRVVDTYQFNALMTKLTEYIDHGTATLPKIDGDIAARLGQISEPQRASRTLANPASGGVSVTNYWWWQDYGDGSGEHDYDDTATGGCNSTMVQHQDQAQADRDAHYAQVLAQLNSQYYAGDPDKAHATVDRWKDMQKEFAQYAPKSS